MMGNYQVRFEGGPMEKWLNGQLASGLPYLAAGPRACAAANMPSANAGIAL
jgi:hypothetical protein